ncbi:group I intron-associated PD-(D/E)XK endonuclease, partial [Candidatus Omnitrophota bacterium]
MHHTKSKADLGLAKVIADLIQKGYVPCIPLSEHQPYDLLAV